MMGEHESNHGPVCVVQNEMMGCFSSALLVDDTLSFQHPIEIIWVRSTGHRGWEGARSFLVLRYHNATHARNDILIWWITTLTQRGRRTSSRVEHGKDAAVGDEQCRAEESSYTPACSGTR